MLQLIDQRCQVIIDGETIDEFAFMVDGATKPSELEQALRNRGYEVREVRPKKQII